MNDDDPFDPIARRLTTPAQCGVYLARNEIVVLARLHDASLRMGERRRMLVDVWKSAGSPAELEAVVVRLADFCRESAARYRELAEAYPGAAALLTPWITKAEATITALEALAEDVHDG
ncbi:MAG: hypothetical protein ABMA64_39865 [Myxococcota bacterium]